MGYVYVNEMKNTFNFNSLARFERRRHKNKYQNFHSIKFSYITKVLMQMECMCHIFHVKLVLYIGRTQSLCLHKNKMVFGYMKQACFHRIISLYQHIT